MIDWDNLFKAILLVKQGEFKRLEGNGFIVNKIRRKIKVDLEEEGHERKDFEREQCENWLKTLFGKFEL